MHTPAICDVLGCPWACTCCFFSCSGLGWVESNSGACSEDFFLFLEHQAYCYATNTLALACLSCTDHLSVQSTSMCFIFSGLLLPVKNTNIMTEVLFSSSKICCPLSSLSCLRSRALGHEASVVLGLLRL